MTCTSGSNDDKERKADDEVCIAKVIMNLMLRQVFNKEQEDISETCLLCNIPPPLTTTMKCSVS